MHKDKKLLLPKTIQKMIHEIEFDYNVPAEFTLSGKPDLFLKVKASVMEKDGEATGAVIHSVESEGVDFLDVYKPFNIYRHMNEIAKQRIPNATPMGNLEVNEQGEVKAVA